MNVPNWYWKPSRPRAVVQRIRDDRDDRQDRKVAEQEQQFPSVLPDRADLPLNQADDNEDQDQRLVEQQRRPGRHPGHQNADYKHRHDPGAYRQIPSLAFVALERFLGKPVLGTICGARTNPGICGRQIEKEIASDMVRLGS